MRADTGSEVHLSPFRAPVPYPVTDPTAEPTISIDINCQWLPYIRGALLALTEQYTYPQTDPTARVLAQARAQTLISMFIECDNPGIPFACDANFKDSESGYVGYPMSLYGYSPSPQAQWTTSGWTYIDSSVGTTNLRACYLALAIDPTSTITNVIMKYDLLLGVGAVSGYYTGFQFLDSSYGLVDEQDTEYQMMSNGSGLIYSVVGNWTGVSWLMLEVTCDAAASGPVFGDCAITEAHVYGVGTPPCS